MNVNDLRGQVNKVNFDDDGIIFVHSHSEVNQFETNRNWQAQYDKEIISVLQKTIGTEEVIVFDHTLRTDSPNAERKPARDVHNDYSPQGAQQRLIDLVGNERAAKFQDGHFGFVNVWRPVEHMLTTSPLGFIHPQSMQAEDWMTIELIYSDRKGQILGVANNPDHEWFYQSNMQPSEIIIFNIYDNQGRPHLAHSALDIVDKSASTLPRKSIETRTLVRYT